MDEIKYHCETCGEAVREGEGDDDYEMCLFCYYTMGLEVALQDRKITRPAFEANIQRLEEQYNRKYTG
jgi:hypothetical protein